MTILHDLPTLHDDRLLTRKQAEEYTGIPTATLAELEYRGRGPKVVRIGGNGRSTRYRVRDLRAWIDSRTTQSTVDRRAK